jgi:hypothetical protein
MLLSVEGDAKTVKGSKVGWLTGILYLAPANTANRKVNLCPHASKGCKKACLNTSGRGRFDSIQEARIRKTLDFLHDRESFLEQLCEDIEKLERRAAGRGLRTTVRLNGTSDLAWETAGLGRIPQQYPHIQFYDYTKSVKRAIRQYAVDNYHLTFSRSEANDQEVKRVLKAGHNVAAVFKGGLPDELYGFNVIDGDQHDLRFLDPEPTVIGLKAKGMARHDKSGFVIQQHKEMAYA